MKTQKPYYITTEKISVGYDGKPLIEEVEIALRKGEILTLLGPNGAGKSTILKSIARQLSLIAGTVRLDGEDMKSLTGAELSKKMAVVMTKRLRGELMTCEDVVATGRYPYTGRFGVLRAEDHAAVQNAMELVQVAGIADSLFDRISDGQRQRVMLARAICQEPEIIILDEPTSFLDIRHKLELLNTLKKLVREKNTAVLMSLHELDLALRVSDKIVCIDGGKVGRVGTPEEIFSGGYISALYGISEVCFCESSGCAELEKPAGAPEVFVISGGGNSGGVFRRLQRAGTPFAAGIIPANDIDLPAARALAAEVISRPAFSEASQEAVQRGLRLVGECGGVICCPGSCGALNPENSELLSCARRLGKLISDA